MTRSAGLTPWFYNRHATREASLFARRGVTGAPDWSRLTKLKVSRLRQIATDSDRLIATDRLRQTDCDRLIAPD